MKCAAAVIRSCSVRLLRLSIHAVNQAGTDGVTNETIHTGRPPTVALPSTCASWTSLPHVGPGTCRVVDWDSTHLPPGLVRSHRRAPITTAAAPPWIWYVSRSGLAIRQVVTSPTVGPERSDST